MLGVIKALVVDDEREYVHSLTELLATRGMQVTGVFTGEEALEVLASRPMNVVVLDVLMPGQGGIETLKQIKHHHPDTAVIMLSGHADVSTAIKGMELGAFDYLVKPIAFDELFYKIVDAAGIDPAE